MIDKVGTRELARKLVLCTRDINSLAPCRQPGRLRYGRSMALRPRLAAGLPFRGCYSLPPDLLLLLSLRLATGEGDRQFAASPSPCFTRAYRMTVKASTSTRGRPAVPDTLTSSMCVPEVAQLLLKTTSRYCALEENRSTVVTLTPSIHTSARPRSESFDETQATSLPVKVNLAVAPAVTEYFTLPP